MRRKIISGIFLIACVLTIPVFSQSPGVLPIEGENSLHSQVTLLTRIHGKPRPGIPLQIELVLHNQGNLDVEDVFLHQNWEKAPQLVDANPAPVIQGNRWTWEFQKLAGQKDKTISLKVIPGQIEFFRLNPILGFKPAIATVEVPTDPLQVHIDGPTWVRRGDRAVFEIHLVNHGNIALEGVTIRDQLPNGLKHPEGGLIEADLGAIPAGKTRTIRLEALAVATGKFTQEIQVVFANGSKKNYTSGISIGDAHCKLEWKKIKEEPGRGELEMALEGLFLAEDNNSQSVNIQVKIPEGLELVSHYPEGKWVPSAKMEKKLQWGGAGINLGKWEARLKFRAVKPGDWPLQAEASLEETPGAKADFLVRIEGKGELSGAFEKKNLTLPLGQDGEIRFHLKNTSLISAQNAQFHFVVPEGLFPVSWNGPTVGGLEGGVIRFDPIKEIPSLKEVTFLLKVRSLRNGSFKLVSEFGESGTRQVSICEITCPSSP